ncbi:hypothetical protein QS414_05615 [Staphylococcus pseudintermedius]|nr:hypothetical protein [Staphylococcus pseudintermedius]WMZ75077.1 hypothetical protein QS414_05615 [Staphylococcus pseudintermedius]
MGGFYGVKRSGKPNAKRVMVAAHMDEIGFMITEVTPQGFIKFTALGGVANDIWQGQRLKIMTQQGEEIIGIYRLAEMAYHVNQETDNIGARRLHTILEKMLEDLSFEAPNMPHAQVDITPQYVDDKLKTISTNKDLSEFIL